MGRSRRVLGLSYERRGDGEPLLLIHGAGSYRRVWEPLMDVLAVERCTCLEQAEYPSVASG